MVLHNLKCLHCVSECGVNDSHWSSFDPTGDIQTNLQLVSFRVFHAAELVGDYTPLGVKGNPIDGHASVPNALDEDVAIQVA